MGGLYPKTRRSKTGKLEGNGFRLHGLYGRTRWKAGQAGGASCSTRSTIPTQGCKQQFPTATTFDKSSSTTSATPKWIASSSTRRATGWQQRSPAVWKSAIRRQKLSTAAAALWKFLQQQQSPWRAERRQLLWPW